MLDWYAAIKSKIDACPTSICTTCTTFESEDLEKIGQIGQIDSPQVEKSLLPDSTPQHEYTDLKSVPMFTNVNGKPLHCIHCPAWLQGQSVWWSGTCLHTGESRTNKSRCDLLAYEENVYGK